MFSFNRNERIVILLLTGTLLVGAGVRLLNHYMDDGLPDFEVRKGAVQVPTDPAKSGSGPREETSQRIDLNKATAEELERLPRIGPRTAARIVDYRNSHGPFQRVEDLEGVKGIGKKTVAKLRHLVLVSAP